MHRYVTLTELTDSTKVLSRAHLHSLPVNMSTCQDLANRSRGFMRLGRCQRAQRKACRCFGLPARPEKIEILQLPKSVIGRVIGKASTGSTLLAVWGTAMGGRGNHQRYPRAHRPFPQ